MLRSCLVRCASPPLPGGQLGYLTAPLRSHGDEPSLSAYSAAFAAHLRHDLRNQAGRKTVASDLFSGAALGHASSMSASRRAVNGRTNRRSGFQSVSGTRI